MAPIYENGEEYVQLVARANAQLLVPNATQRATLIVAAVYVLIILVLPILKEFLYPFKLLTVGMHEMCHAIAGVLTCAKIESIQLDPDEGGATRMRGGIPLITLPAGYLGSSMIGAALITCGFDTCASRVATIVLGVFFLLTLVWARKSFIAWLTILFAVALLIVCWLVASSVALRYLVLFMGVMSCMYCVWDVFDDTLKRKVNGSDASEFARLYGGSSRMWGMLWFVLACAFFALGIILGIIFCKDSTEVQKERAAHFLGGTP